MFKITLVADNDNKIERWIRFDSDQVGKLNSLKN